jgi:hypothetical protein
MRGNSPLLSAHYVPGPLPILHRTILVIISHFLPSISYGWSPAFGPKDILVSQPQLLTSESKAIGGGGTTSQ